MTNRLLSGSDFKIFSLLVAAGSLVALAGCSSGAKKESSPSTPSTPSAQEGAQSVPMAATVTEDVRETGTKESIAEPPKTRSIEKKYEALSNATRAGKASVMQEEASKLLSANPGDPVALNALAIYHLRRGRTGAAKVLLEKAFEKNPQNAALLNNLGVVLLEEGDVHGAIANFKRAIKLDDGHVESLGNLGSIYLRAGDVSKAEPFLAQAYKSGKSNAAIANNYAVVLRIGKDLEGARKIYEGIIERNSRDISALLNLAILYIDFLNRPKDGLSLVYKLKVLETERKDIIAKANALEKKAKSELK
jgi:Flp pilus assembly protein TadD